MYTIKECISYITIIFYKENENNSRKGILKKLKFKVMKKNNVTKPG